MDSKQETKLSMYIVVRDYLTQNLSILNALPNFSSSYASLQNIITQIQTSGEEQSFDKSGNAADKNLAKNTLVTLAADTSRKLTAYSKFSNNQVLLKEINISTSELKRMADTKLKNVAQGIYDRAQANIAMLEDYLIKADTQTALQAALNNFDKTLGQPRLGTTETSKITKQLVSQFKSADAAIDNIDTAVEIIRSTQIDFYNGYKSARKLVNNRVSTLAIKGIVTDAATGSALRGVKLTFSINGDSLTKTISGFTKKSANKGGFLVRAATDGTYNVSAELPGYKKANTTVSVVSGQMTILDIALEKD